MAWWDPASMRPPTRPIPKGPAKPLKFTRGYQYHAKGVPAGEQATYWELARAFRGGDLYAFSWDAKRGAWETWRTEADWLATERNGATARPDLAAAGHGPEIHVTEKPARKPRAARATSPAPAPVVVECDHADVDEIRRRLEILVYQYRIPRSTLRVLEAKWTAPIG
jgi:hypothetical protein